MRIPEKKSRFLLELNKMPNRGGRVATDFVRLFNFQCIKTTFSSSSTAQPILAEISLESTDKELFLSILSVIAIFRASHLRTEGSSYTITITVDTVILSNAEPDESARQTISITEGDYHACAKIGQICNRLQSIRFFQFATEFFPTAF